MSDSKQVDDSLMLSRLMQEIRLRDRVHQLTDRELVHELIENVWGRIPMWTWPAVVLDEAITRLRRADTRRRWQERKEQRAARIDAKRG